MEYAYDTRIYTLCLKKVSTFKLSVNSSYILTDFIFFCIAETVWNSWQAARQRLTSHARTEENIQTINDLIMSQEDKPQTHRTVCEISPEMGSIGRLCPGLFVKTV